MVLASTGNSLSLRSKIEQLSLSLQCCCIVSMPAQARMLHVQYFWLCPKEQIPTLPTT